MQGNYVKLAHLLACELREMRNQGLISGSLTPEHHIDSHTMSGVLMPGTRVVLVLPRRVL
jgi:hypothetical protein